MPELQVPVLVVGGGVVGLSASLFLAQGGVRSVLVERHPGTSIHPRARGVNGRTMELLRELGLEEDVKRAGDKIAPSVGIYSGVTLKQVLDARGDGGWFLQRVRARGVRGQESKQSPVSACRCTQDDLEPILLRAAKERGVDARFSTELISIEQGSEDVAATIVDRQTGEERVIRAQYIIAADGAKSPMRERLGVTQSGRGVMTHQMNLYFRSDLASLVKGREFSMCQIENPDVRGLLASVNNSDLWVMHVSYYPEKGERPEDFTEERCINLIRKAIGIPSLDVTIKGALPWQSAVRIADSYQVGRVFLAGDAAHVMPPWGGFGANTGIQDAHNLAWKIALVLSGSAGPSLLSTYQTERQPVARVVGEIAGSMNDARGLMNFKPRFGFLGMLWNMRRVLPYMTMGYGYSSPAVAVESGAPPGPGTKDLRGRPGTRAPHVWLTKNGERLSTLDLFGRGFVLLVGQSGSSWLSPAKRASESLTLPLEVIQLGVHVFDGTNAWCSAYGVKPDGASLIRPDGIVAWRAPRCPISPESALDEVFSRILMRS